MKKITHFQGSNRAFHLNPILNDIGLDLLLENSEFSRKNRQTAQEN